MDSVKKYYLGIDGGGTKCKVRLEDDQGNLLAESIAGPANAARDLDGSIDAILHATKMVILAADVEGLTSQDIHAGIGLAGLNIPDIMKAFKEKTLPFASTNITSDLHIACLGAHQQDDGAIVIIGTGSSGLVIKSNQQFEYGGHGLPVGDKASGAWFGKMAITHCLEVCDGIKESDRLTKEVMAFLECENAYALVNLTLAAKPDFYATLAPVIFNLAKDNEHYAKLLVEDAADYINKLSHQLLKLTPARLSFIGGITSHLIPYLSPQLQALIKAPLGTPEQGAILYAKSQLMAKKNI